MKKLPIGIQSFDKIRSDDFYYVDKIFIFKSAWMAPVHKFTIRFEVRVRLTEVSGQSVCFRNSDWAID